jgi:hypothetical protein
MRYATTVKRLGKAIIYHNFQSADPPGLRLCPCLFEIRSRIPAMGWEETTDYTDYTDYTDFLVWNPSPFCNLYQSVKSVKSVKSVVHLTNHVDLTSVPDVSTAPHHSLNPSTPLNLA